MPDNEVESSRFKVPKSPKRNIYEITKFLGCDFTSSPTAVDLNHSSDCVNMIRHMPGKVRKRMGYESIIEGTGKVFAIWKWDNDNYLVHVGKKLFHIGRDNKGELDFSVIHTLTDTNYSQVIKDSLGVVKEFSELKYHYIRSGSEGLIFGNGQIFFYNPKYEGNDTADNIYDTGDYEVFVPTVTISKSPSGGGTSYEPFNLLSEAFEESFYVSNSEATETVFQLSYEDIKSVEYVMVLDSNGDWQTKVAGTDYTVDLQEGSVTFTTAPGASLVEGEDNVLIGAKKEFDGYYNRIANCRFAIAYGVNGNYDRVFISGNPEYPNVDWFSEMDDITYFPDLGYSVLGSDASPINGYAIVSNYLVTLKGDGSDKQVAIIRSGSFDTDGNTVFTVIKSLQGYPILAPDTSVMAGIEPMFLTQEGIMAITTADITGDYMMNSRSFFLNGKLMKEQHLNDAFAIRNGDYYMLFVNGHVYILDTLQAITSENTPYSTRQYATFYWDNIPATCAITIDEVVYFGTADGEIMKFYTDENALASYNDNGAAIYCRYDTADLDANIFFKLKTYRYFALRVFPAIASSVKIYAYKDGEWELLKDDSATIRYFTFSQLVFSKLTFRTDRGTRLVNSKARIKKMDHVRFRIENDVLDEPLMVDQFGIEFTQSGNYKN